MREYRVIGVDGLKYQWPRIKEQCFSAFGRGVKELLITVQMPRRNSLKNAEMHAIMTDIHQQASLNVDGEIIPMSRYDFDVCKCLLVRWFDLELQALGEPLRKSGRKVVDPATGDVIYMRPSTTDFTQAEAAKFVQFLYAFGVERGVKFRDRKDWGSR